MINGFSSGPCLILVESVIWAMVYGIQVVGIAVQMRDLKELPQGTQELAILWPHIPATAIVSCTWTISQDNIGS